MSKSNNLTDFLTDLANTIRSKKGYSASTKLNPQNFSNEIAGIVSGDIQSETVYLQAGDYLEFNSEDYPFLILSGYIGAEADGKITYYDEQSRFSMTTVQGHTSFFIYFRNDNVIVRNGNAEYDHEPNVNRIRMDAGGTTTSGETEVLMIYSEN